MDQPTQREPLSIWFLVGLILGVYGLIVLLSGFLGDQRATVLAHLRPALWWGAILVVAGATLLFAGRPRGAGGKG